MTFREVSIRYEFPTCEADREAFKECHAKSNRQWVSTAMEGGRQRMKFARFEEREAAPVHYPVQRRLIPYAGKEDR